MYWIYCILNLYRCYISHLNIQNAALFISQYKLARRDVEEEGALLLCVQTISHLSIVEFFQYWLFYFVDAVFSVDSAFSPAAFFSFFPLSPALGCCFLTKTCLHLFSPRMHCKELHNLPTVAHRGQQNRSCVNIWQINKLHVDRVKCGKGTPI